MKYWGDDIKFMHPIADILIHFREEFVFVLTFFGCKLMFFEFSMKSEFNNRCYPNPLSLFLTILFHQHTDFFLNILFLYLAIPDEMEHVVLRVSSLVFKRFTQVVVKARCAFVSFSTQRRHAATIT